MITDQGVAVPEDMADALQQAPDALGLFQQLRPAQQREFVDWVAKAGPGESRAERLAVLAEHVRAYPTVQTEPSSGGEQTR